MNACVECTKISMDKYYYYHKNKIIFQSPYDFHVIPKKKESCRQPCLTALFLLEDFFTFLDIFSYPIKDTVFQQTASDPDLGDKGRVRYSIILSQYVNTAKGRNISVFDAFEINSDSGQVSVGFQSYKYFIGGYFELTIKGEDYLNTNMYSTYKLKVGSSIAIGM